VTTRRQPKVGPWSSRSCWSTVTSQRKEKKEESDQKKERKDRSRLTRRQAGLRRNMEKEAKEIKNK
jgi:hypothetical protein